MLGVGEKVKSREKRRKSKEQRMTTIRGFGKKQTCTESDITILSCWTEKNQLTLL